MPKTELRDGTWTEDARLDLVSEPDVRNDEYGVLGVLTEEQLARPRSFTWRVTKVLDQGSQGACVGFAWAHELLARPAPVTRMDVDARFAKEHIYWAAQRRDRYPGGAYPGAKPLMAGTSTLAGAKVVKDMGYMKEYRWARTLEETIAALAFKGPVLLGGTWFSGLHNPDSEGFVTPTGSWRGGHCVLLTAVRVRWTSEHALDERASVCTFQNSWGADWGKGGQAFIRLADLRQLIQRGRCEMCVPIERTSRLEPPQ